ncbi:endolytic transglycosylase MltG [Blastococcus sp. TF02A-30]|uniref:endolytic transglycosylase MltG n=1 Tax=Blastococcus sp. TF02A-30 TaxID=2250580 RepID=UPI000DEA2FFF|nr:endolytic transglycosylase MltG [Blastococcus sp. TF02A-30]RBY85681.1 endolytic transglycosylase MltG [Blastococcus sp. TF02A-30]
MTEPGGPRRRGRHSSPGEGAGGSFPWTQPGGYPSVPGSPDAPTDGFRPVSGLVDHRYDQTGPLAEPAWWSYGSSDHPDYPRARHGADEEPAGTGHLPDTQHPSAPLPPLPPRPAGVWDRLHARPGEDDDATVAQHFDPRDLDPAEPVAPPQGGAPAWDETGGLDVIGANVDEGGAGRRWGRRRARRDDDLPPVHADDHLTEDGGALEHGGAAHGADVGHEHVDRQERAVAPADHDDEPLTDDEIPIAPYDPRSDRRRRRRRPWAVLLSLLVLGGIVVGIVLGGQLLLDKLSAKDYTGEGTGTVEIRVQNGDTLSDIAGTLVDADVIASVGPFVDAAEARPEAMGIQPGVYRLRLQMSGAAAVDLLLDPASRLLSRVTVPEGLTLQATLTRLAEKTGVPIEELQAAAADPVALGLPAYANGQLEGYLFPATYDFEPETTPAEMLRAMVTQFTTVAGSLQLEQRAAAMGRTPAEIVTVASMVQSETRLDAERPDVAQVIYNRLGQGIALGIDATLAYGLDKSGNDLTVTDLQTDSPYNTRTRPGLPPTAISAPGEASLEAALAPSTGNLLYYVLQSSEGEHFFTADYAEFQAARQRCADAGLGCGGG